MLKFVESTFNHDLSCEDYRTIFGMVKINQSVSLPNRNDISAIIRQVTTNIKSNDEKKKKMGFTWLYEIVSMSSNEILIHNCQMWMKLAVDILTNASNMYKEEVFKICRVLLHRLPSSEISLFSDEISSLVQHILLTNPSEKFVTNLECLEIILKRVPDVCKHHVKSIEYFLISHLGSFNEKGVEVLAACLSCLPSLYGEQCGNVWSCQFTKIINTLIKLMDIFYRVISLEMMVEVQECYNIPDVRGHPYPFIFYLRYFNTLCICAAKMISGNSVHSAFPTRKIMQFIDIVFSYSEKANNMNHHNATNLPWLTILPNMIKSTSELLENLILNCWEVLHGYSSSILTIIVTKLNAYIIPDSNLRALRCCFYRIVGALTLKLQDASLGNHYSLILSLLLEDIQPLSLENKMAIDGRYDMVTSSSHMISENLVTENLMLQVKRKCCHEALRVLSTLIATGNICNMEDFVEQLLKIFKVVSLVPSFLFPYDDDTARYQLYHILLSAVTKLPRNESKYFATSLEIFYRGVRDIDIQIANFCQMAVHFSLSLPSAKQVTSKEQCVYNTESSADETLRKHLTKDYFNDFDLDIIPKEVIESLASEPDEVITNHVSVANVIQDVEQEDRQLNNHNDDEDMDEEELLENESIEDEQMNESEEEGEVDDEEEDEEDDEIEEEEEEEIEDESKFFGIEGQEEKHESQKKEKSLMDNGYFTMQNGTISSDEGTPTVNDKGNHDERSQNIEDSPPTKKLKHVDERSQDGSVSDSDSMNLNSMMADFVDKPPEEDGKS